jgi:hypothetical protein
MITADELTAMRATILLTMPSTGIIQRTAVAPDGMGGKVETWNAVGATSCRISPGVNAPWRTMGANAVLQEIQGGLDQRQGILITVPAGTDIRPYDRLVVGPHTYSIVSVWPDRTYEIAMRVMAFEVD